MKNTRKQALPILATLNALNKKHGKLYCFPGQVKIMALLSSYHNTNIAIATLNRWLKDIEEKGLIRRRRRIKHDKKLGTVFQSTLYNITAAGYHALKAVGADVYRELKEIAAASIQGAHKRLSKYTGPVALKTILGEMPMLGVKSKVFIVEKG